MSSQMKVLFSFHSAERMKQRLNLDVSTKYDVDISSAFTKSHTYKHTSMQDTTCVAYVHKDKTMPIVLIIDAKTRIVMTVLLGKKITNQNAPFVNECYAKIGVSI